MGVTNEVISSDGLGVMTKTMLVCARHGANYCVRKTLQPENNFTQRVQLGSRYFNGKGVNLDR